MTKLQKIFLGVFLLLLAGMVYLEATKPTPVNWFPSYNNEDEIPLGTVVLYDILEQNFRENLTEIDRPPYEVLQDSTLKGTYLFINDYITFDEAELDKLYQWTQKGNTVFISANSIGDNLLDTLQLKTQTNYLTSNIKSEPLLNLTHKKLAARKPYHIPRNFNVESFSNIDTLNHTVLGFSEVYDGQKAILDSLPNFIKAPVENGNFYLHLQPEAFSNYFLLTKNHVTYTTNALSYLPKNKQLFWDKEYKSGKHVNISPLHILLGNKYLKWAYYTLLTGVLLFVLFEGKRKQRSIPIVAPPKNRTYQYTRTISGMYLDKKDYHSVTKKQISLFFEYIRIQLQIPTEQQNSRFFSAVAGKTGNTVEDTKKLFTFIEKVNNQYDTSKEELQQLYNDIQAFKTKAHGKP
ncbi:DUF4350 domain-containing protein [Marixanthomonas spongiae]|uniref:DUF4350 domain-containing protein n=1 Tax=Marixanthomonas spongiae TaxID=2174845 RepID=A0A2U0I3M9_9FLAO|nr:DUF4350 domain-containing protein [Marixanthomonas spongiae]PVW15699.1 DUF4350 domain-containing protein [Marixanthomonas spongiae]